MDEQIKKMHIYHVILYSLWKEVNSVVCGNIGEAEDAEYIMLSQSTESQILYDHT